MSKLYTFDATALNQKRSVTKDISIFRISSKRLSSAIMTA